MLVVANHLASIMHSELKQPEKVMLFPLVGICYNISLLMKRMASYLPCFKENMIGTAELKRATTSNSRTVFGSHSQMDRSGP